MSYCPVLIPRKWSRLQHLILTAIRYEHPNILKKLYGRGKFFNNKSFGSKQLFENTYAESVGTIYQNFDKSSILLDKKEEEAVINTLNQLHSLEFDFYSRPLVPCITCYSRQHADKS